MVKEHIQREDFAVVHMVADLPAKAAIGREDADEFREERLHFRELLFNGNLPFVGFANVVGWR